jgi:hypothetical protein
MVDLDNRVFVKQVKGLFKPELLTMLREKVSDLGNKQSRESISEREKNAVERGESTDTLRMQTTWYDVWKDPVARSILLDAIAPFTYVIYPVQVRHVRKAHQHHVPWHQDIAYIRLLGKRSHLQVITCFIPLEAEPAKCTTIQYAFDNHENPDHVYKHTPLEGFGAGIADLDFKNVKHFDLELGDALIFGDHTLHRTYLPENCNVERRSLEFRLVLPEHAICDKDYFDIKSLAFVRFDADMKMTPEIIV